jgi:hypothetical protein
MRYHFIAFVMVMSAIKATPPLLTAASGLNARSTSIQAEHVSLENNNTREEHTATYIHLHRESPWPTCWDMIECLKGCCYAVYVLTKLCIQDAQRETNGNDRQDYYQGFDERRNK